MTPLPPYLATDFPIYQELDRSWGSTPVVARVAQRRSRDRFGQLFMLRQPELEVPFILLAKAAVAVGNDELVESYLAGLRAVLWDHAGLGIEDEDLLEFTREYFSRAISEVRAAKGWRKAGAIPFCRHLEQGLVAHDDATGAGSFFAFQNMIGAVDPSDGQRVRNTRCAGKAEGPPPAEFRGVIAAMAATLSRAVIDPVGILRSPTLDPSKPQEGSREGLKLAESMAGTRGPSRSASRR